MDACVVIDLTFYNYSAEVNLMQYNSNPMTAKRGSQLQVSCIESENVLIFFHMPSAFYSDFVAEYLTVIIRLTSEDKKNNF